MRFSLTGHQATDASFAIFAQDMRICPTEGRRAFSRFWELATGNHITFAPPALRIEAGTAEYQTYRAACPDLDARLYSGFENHLQCHPDPWQRSYVREPLTWAPA